MDDEEYVATDTGKAVARELINRISPTNDTLPPTVQANFAALSPQQKRIVKAWLRKKLSTKTKSGKTQKLNLKETNVVAAIGV